MRGFKFSISSLAILLISTATLLASTAGSPLEAPESPITEKMMMLVLQVGVILFAARLGGMLAERARLPGVLGELLAGVAIGPHALGAIQTGRMFPDGIFPLASSSFPISPELYAFCSVAAVILLFLAGVETDLSLLLRYSVAGSLVGIAGVVFSFLAGNLLAGALLPALLPDTYQGGISFMHPARLFLGIMSTATSVGITARILSERRKVDSPEGVTILAGAVFDDVLGIIVLAIGIGVIAAGEKGGEAGFAWGHIGLIAGKAFGIWLGATAVGIVAARRISKLLKLFKNPVSIAVMALGLALILAGLFEEMGLAMIIGAYVMGLALSRTDIRNVIQENLHPVYAFMVPIFFTVMGMMVDLGQLTSSRVLIFGGIYTLLAIVAKILGCGAAAYATGFTWLGALRIGAGMVPRGEVALIVAGIGLSAGFLSPEIFGVGILMTLVTTLAAPPLLVWLFNLKGSSLRHPTTGKEVSHSFSFEMPSRGAAKLMCSQLLDAFRADGFFTHTLSHQDSIYQMRSDDVEIGMRREGASLHFECSPSEEAVVSAVLLEVIAHLESVAQELRRPIDTGALRRSLLESPDDQKEKNGDSSYSHLTETYVKPALVVTDLAARSKEEAISELVKFAQSKGLVRDLERVQAAVLARETQSSTALGNGVAIPHARTTAVPRIFCIVARSRQGIDFSSPDGEPARIIILIVSPPDSGEPYMRLIAHISRALNPEGRRLLLSAKNAEEMAAAINRQIA